MKMNVNLKLILIILWTLLEAVASSKLNVPRVLLPLFHDFTTNFTLEVKDSGCYKWRTLRPNVIDLKPQYSDPILGCSSEAVVSAITKGFSRNTETVLAEDVRTGNVIRCEVIVDVIHSLNIITTTRELFLEESPEAFEVRAYDDQGNEFSTLEGVEFKWTLSALGCKANRTSCDVLRLINFEDSPYETPPSISVFDKTGQQGHIILLEGAQTGAAQVSVELPYKEYEYVPCASVQLMVLTNLIITPTEVVLLPGDCVTFSLYQIQHGKLLEIELPSTQYYLRSDEPNCLHIDEETGLATAKEYCQTKVTLVDRNVIASLEDADIKPVSSNVIITYPDHISLALLPSRRLFITMGRFYEIIVEIFDSNNRKFHIGENVEVETHIDNEYLQVDFASTNGTYHVCEPIQVGETKVTATLFGVVDGFGALHRTDKLTAQALIKIYDKIEVTPSYVLLPYDPLYKSKYEIPLNVSGGDGSYMWTSGNNNIALVTQSGLVKTQEEGSVTITAAMVKNQHCSDTSMFYTTPPTRMEIVEYKGEDEVGNLFDIYIAMYGEVNGKEVAFTACDALPFHINIHEDNFKQVETASSLRVGNACGSITVVGTSPGPSKVTVTYGVLEATTIISAYNPLIVKNPESKTVILAVGSSRVIRFVGGPRAWSSRPSEHSYRISLQSEHVDSDTDKSADLLITEVKEREYQRDVYTFNVLCKSLGEETVELFVYNKFPALNARPSEAHESVNIICAKPRYLIISPVIKVPDPSNCPLNLNSERIIAQNYRDIELEVTVTDLQGRKFDNFSSLEIKWTNSHPSLAEITELEVLPVKNVLEDDLLLPGTFYQIIRPLGRTGVLELKAVIEDYDMDVISVCGIVPERPPFPQRNALGQMATPDIKAILSIILVNDTYVTPNNIEVYNANKTNSKLTVSQGSGFYQLSLGSADVIDIKYSHESKVLQVLPIDVGSTTITLLDLCLHSPPVVVNVRVFTIASLSVDVAERVEKGKSVTANVELYDEDGTRINVSIDRKTIGLRPIAESGIIKVKLFQEQSDIPSVVKYLVSGVQLGTTYLKFAVGTKEKEIHSQAAPIQVFPALRISPRVVEILVGATIQVEVFDGPADGVVEFSSSDEKIAQVSTIGVIEGVKIGKTILTAKSISASKTSGAKTVVSEDTIEVNVIPLAGISIQAPLTRIVEGGVMPLRAVGKPDKITSMVLGSAKLNLIYKWSIGSDNAQIVSVFDEMGLRIPDCDKVTMRLKALKPGRVAVKLSVSVPKNIAGSMTSATYTDTLQIEIFPSLALTQPQTMSMTSLLLTPNAKTHLGTTRDTVSQGRIQYFVSPLRDITVAEEEDVDEKERKCVATVSDKGTLYSCSNFGRCVVTFVLTEDYGVRIQRSVIVDVKPVHYVMINVASKLKIKKNYQVENLPTGFDVEFYLSFHDNFGNKFDAVESDILLESTAKDIIKFKPGGSNTTSLIASSSSKGTSVLKMWDVKSPIQPADYVKIRTGDIVFPSDREVCVGDVICFHMPILSRDETKPSWNVDNTDLLQLNKEIGLGVICEPGVAHVKYDGSTALSTKLQALPIASIEFAQQKKIVSTLENTDVAVILKNKNELDKSTNLISVNGTCSPGFEQYELRCLPISCTVDFDVGNPVIDITSLLTVYPYFDFSSGQYFCRISPVAVISKRASTINYNIRLVVTTYDGRHSAGPIVLPFAPAAFLHQLELRVSQRDPTAILQVTASLKVLQQIEVLPEDRDLVSITLEEKTDNTRTYSVDVEPIWWEMEDPPTLSVLFLSQEPDQHIRVPIKCTGHKMVASEPEVRGPFQWFIILLAFVAGVLFLYSNFILPSSRPLAVRQYQGDSHYITNNSLNDSHNRSDASPSLRPFGESPVYGSPTRYRSKTPWST